MAPEVEAASIAIDQDGIVYLVYGGADNNGLNHFIYYIRSDDDGGAWSEPKLVFTYTSPVRSYVENSDLAIDGKKRFHVGITIRSLEYSIYSIAFYLQSLDYGATWIQRELLPEGRPGLALLTPYTFGDDEVHLTCIILLEWINSRMMGDHLELSSYNRHNGGSIWGTQSTC